MRFGDLSNYASPTIVIDIDGLIIKETQASRNWLSQFVDTFKRSVSLQETFLAKTEVKKYKLNEDIYPLLENLFYKDVGIYFFAHRPFHFQEFLEDKLEPLLYNGLYVGGIKEREALLRRRHIHLYYYRKPEHASILSKDKERRIDHYRDIDLW